MEIKLENLLSVRVGRVVPRDVDVSSFVSAEEYKQFFSDFTAFDISLLDNYKDKWVLVPTPVNIYLGEVFSFYLTCTNDSIQEVMTNVHIRIDMQSGNRAIFLKEFNIETLDAKATIDTVLGHEIKEPFTHVLICTMGFNIAGHERQTCRRFFQFQVSKPIDVKTKSYYTESDEIYLEALFQNLTNLPIQLKNVNLESNDFEVSSLNFMQNDSSEKWIFGQVNRLNTMESRQYLFMLKPKEEARINPALIKAITTIGKLDIVWLSGIGEKGHIQTSQLERTTSSGDSIKIFVDEIPTQVYINTIFKVKFRIVNCSSKEVEPTLHFVNTEHQNIQWLGLANKTLQQLKQSESADVEMRLYPTKAGLFSIPLVKVADFISKENYDYKELAFVNII
ncbi:Trafficking protein particle complex subunit 13 [Tyrophagus putrescentiae]|nr:Trafficking protein particle complex subunit 13 [Tyrophagus putrescentiae]